VTLAELHAFLCQHRLAVVATTANGSPQAAVVGIAVADTLDIVFDTIGTSRKYQNLRTDPRIAMVVGWDGEQTVQIEGTADLPSGAALEACKKIYFAAWPDGRQRENWPNIAYVCVRPRWVRYSDFGRTPARIEEMRLE
jgi:pyridoxine/pyridoxamine 5'-phosphate oxidase